LPISAGVYKMAETSSKAYCCTSSRSLCFCGLAFSVFYAVGLAVIFSLHLGKYQLTVLFAALGLSCIATFIRNRTFHCVVTGPVFLIAAILFALGAAGIWKIRTGLLWVVVGIVVCAAFCLERRFAA
jgi:hypothetical protein